MPSLADKARGRRIVGSIALSILLASIASAALTALVGGEPAGPTAVRLVLTGLLSLLMYQGHSWARWVIVLLLAVAAIIGIAGGLVMFHEQHPVDALLAVGLAVIQVALAAVLSFGRSVAAFYARDTEGPSSPPAQVQ